MSLLSDEVTMDAVEVATRGGGRTTLTGEQLRDLQSRLDGGLSRPGNDGWETAVQIWNGMVAKTPALVVEPTSAEDVANIVRLAREKDLLLSIKGGGHNIGGTSIAADGLTLYMGRMRSVTVDPQQKLAHVEAGCLLQDVDRETQKHGLATVLGFVSETGVAGLTLGGGLGYLARRFGWTVDNLLEIEVVTSDGSIRVANREKNDDLFWAIRGGGGNFGVVTRFTFRLHDVGPTVYGGLIAWPFDRAEEIQHAYQAITETSPRELAVWLVLLNAPPAPFVPPEWQGKRICAMSVCYSGDLRNTDKVLAPIRALGNPVVNLLQELPYTQMQSYLDATEPKGAHYYWKTEFLPELDKRLLKTMRDLFAECSIPQGQLGLLHIGGALNEQAWDDGAVGNRNARFACGLLGMWPPNDPRGDAHRQWVRNGWERIRPYSTGGTYINFQTADEGEDRIRETYGPNFKRLVEIKQKYDPENLFRVNRNIPPETPVP